MFHMICEIIPNKNIDICSILPALLSKLTDVVAVVIVVSIIVSQSCEIHNK